MICIVPSGLAMLVVLIATALGRAGIASPGSTLRSAGALHLQIGADLRTSQYTGGFFGVQAEVALDERDGVAALELNGLPLGGRLVGQARLDAEGGVRLDPRLEAALARRFVSVLSVRRSREDVLEVVLRLPLLGFRKLGMRRSG